MAIIEQNLFSNPCAPGELSIMPHTYSTGEDKEDIVPKKMTAKHSLNANTMISNYLLDGIECVYIGFCLM